LKVPLKTRKIAVAASIAAALVFVLGVFLIFGERASLFSNEIFLAVILITMVPYAILDTINQRWINAVEDQMPVLVRGIAESQETGLTLVDALENVVKNKMVRGPLAKEVKKLTVQMSWGLSFEDALRKFKERIGSPIVSRFCALVLEASVSGGQIRKVFTATSGFMEDMKEIDRETAAQMRPYLIIVYTTFFVFMFTSIILLNSFFAPLEGYPQILSSVTIIGVKTFKDFYYRTMLVMAVMGGLMAGKISERRIAGGLKHSVIMATIGYAIFFLYMPPNWMVV
jgi:flagellar protein FlaJ